MQYQRKTRVRKRLRARTDRARLTVFVSNKHIYAQIIDDNKGHTLVSASGGKNAESAAKIGEVLGLKAKEKKIQEVVFDRGERRYHGKIKALAEAARAQGLKF